jgi:DNA-binding phage protein
MALTRSFRDTVATRVKRDPAFREALLTEAVQALIAGEPDVGKSVLRDYINATIGFPRLSELTATPAKSLMRMLAPGGNPQARNLCAVLDHLQRETGVRLTVSVAAA